MDTSPFVTGLVLGATLIMAIGAQNAFVLRQGLRREHVPYIVLFCIVADVLLLSVGVAGLGELLGKAPVDCVLLDLSMPDQSGLEVLPKIRIASPETVVVMMSGNATIETAVPATAGAGVVLQQTNEGS